MRGRRMLGLVSRQSVFFFEVDVTFFFSLVDMDLGSIGSMRELGVTESYKLKRQVVLSASEAAEMIIRCVFWSWIWRLWLTG